MSEGSSIRYSGLVIFASKILSAFTGLFFVLILTRSLSKPEFGVWTNIAGFLTTLGIFAGIFPFWSARYTARKFHGALKLGVLSNLLLAIPMAGVAILFGPVLASAAGTSSLFYTYAALIMVQSYAISAMESVVYVVKTHAAGYAYMIQELLKLSLAFPLVFLLHFGIPGALTATFASGCLWIVYYRSVLKPLWPEKIDYKYFWHWVKGSPLNLWIVGAGLIGSLEGYVLLFRGGIIAVAFFGAASVAATPIGFAVGLYAGLYPKLLAGGASEDAEDIIRLTLVFSVPLTIAVIALSPSLLAILRIDYLPAYLIASLLAVRSFLSIFSGTFDAMINGTEKLDLEGKITIRQSLRSRIFQSALTIYIVYPPYLLLLWILLQPFAANPIGAAQVTAELAIIVTIIVTTLKFYIARKTLPIAFPWRSAVKFSLIGIPLGATTFFLNQPLPAFVTLALLVVGAAVYFGLLYVFDKEVRRLLLSIWNHVI